MLFLRVLQEQQFTTIQLVLGQQRQLPLSWLGL